MNRILLALAAVLVAVCIVEAALIARERPPDPILAHKLEQLQKGNDERRTFCGAYARRIAALPFRIADDSKPSDQEAAAVEVLLLSDADFLQVCSADDRLEIGAMRATAIRCHANLDLDCLRGFAMQLMVRVPNPPAIHP
jgi:hypothetical protein